MGEREKVESLQPKVVGSSLLRPECELNKRLVRGHEVSVIGLTDPFLGSVINS